LTELLQKSRAITRTLLKDVNPELRVYQNSDWRIRDIIGHVATWESEVTKTLHAFSRGEEYIITNFEESDFNEHSVQEQQGLSSQDVYEEWEKSREDFIKAIQDISPDQIQDDLLYPWGDERGSIQQLVEYMVEHEEEHKVEIERVIKESKDG
jgi:hypothetical protein